MAQRSARELDRIRAGFALIVAASALVAGLLGLDSLWSALGIAGASALAVFLVRPRASLLLSTGTWIAAGLAGIAMAVAGLIEPTLRPTLLPSGIVACGGMTALFAMLRWGFAAASRVRRPLPLDAKQKVALTPSGEDKTARRAAGSIQAGDAVEVETREIIPVDGTITRGDGFTDDRAITGSDVAVVRSSGDAILAGSVGQIPNLSIRAACAFDQSLIFRKERHVLELIAATEHDRPGPKIAAGIVIALCVVTCVAVIVGRAPISLAAWLPGVAGLLLAAAPGAALLAMRRSRAQLVSTAADRGLLPALLDEATAIARVGRWQIDPRVLSSTAEVEALSFGEVTPGALLGVAHALLEETDVPERQAIATQLRHKKMDPPRPAALRKDRGTWHGTVGGERWMMGTQSTIVDQEKVPLDPTMEGPIAFLKDKHAVVWLVARPKEVVGAVAIRIGIDDDARQAALGLSATLVPGLPDTSRRTIAEAAGITCDGPPLRARDATLASPSSPLPSAGTVVRVIEPRPLVPIGKNQGTVLFAPALATFPETIGLLRRGWKSGLVVAAAVSAVPLIVAGGLVWFDVLGPALGTALGAAALVVAARGGLHVRR